MKPRTEMFGVFVFYSVSKIYIVSLKTGSGEGQAVPIALTEM